MKYIILLTVLSLVLLENPCFANSYFLSNHGNNTASGNSPGDPWKSISKLQNLILKPGDSILFHAGHRFEGTITIRQSGEKDNPIVISSYGKGKKPLITGAVKLSPYQRSNGLWTFKTNKNITVFFVDGEMQTLARYPNNGKYLRIEGGGSDFMIESELKDIPFNVLDANVRIRLTNWSYHFRKIIDIESDTLFFDSETCNTPLSQPGPCFCKPGWGYFFDNKKEFMDTTHEWFFHKASGTVYWLSNSKALDNLFEGTYIESGCVLEKNVSFVSVKNLHFTKYQDKGFFAKGFNDHVELSNCHFSEIYTMAVYFKQGSEYCTIKDNKLYDIYGSGLMLYEMNNFLVEGNSLKRIGLVPGHGLSGISGALGVCICNYETRTEEDTLFNSNNIFRYNHVDSTGWVGIRLDGRNNLMEYNVIENSNITCNDGGLVHTWGGLDSTYTQYSVIKNNIFRYAHGNFKDGARKNHNMSNGIYLDNGSHYMTVENNTVMGVNSGIHVNAGSYGNIITNNTSYGNKKALSFAEWGNGRFWMQNKDNVAYRNTLYNTFNLKHTLSMLHTYGPDFDPVSLDSNLYVSPFEQYHIVKTTVHGERKQTNEYTLKAWQKETGHDQYSTFIHVEDGNRSQIFINDTHYNKTFDLDEGYTWVTLDKSNIADSIIVKPFESLILNYK